VDFVRVKSYSLFCTIGEEQAKESSPAEAGVFPEM